MKITEILIAIFMLLIFPFNSYSQNPEVQAQSQQNTPQEEETSMVNSLALAPARFDLVMEPGTEKTVVVNLVYNSVTEEAQPTRLVATLGDWSITNDGRIKYHPAGTQTGSACSWIIYSPGEITAVPNKTSSIRVTISVPADAKPGDHFAVLFVERRPDNIKLEENRTQLMVNFRMGTIFYVKVPPLTRNISLENLRAVTDGETIKVTPTLKNTGNSYVRPKHSVKIINNSKTVVAEISESNVYPVMGNSEVSPTLQIKKILPPGSYLVRYTIDSKDGSGITEGQVDLIVKENISSKEEVNRSSNLQEVKK